MHDYGPLPPWLPTVGKVLLFTLGVAAVVGGLLLGDPVGFALAGVGGVVGLFVVWKRHAGDLGWITYGDRT